MKQNQAFKSQAEELRRRPRPGELTMKYLLAACAALSVLITVGIVVILLKESILFFSDPEVNIFQFFTGTQWQPAIGKFGVLPLINATLMTSLTAMLVATPLGLFVAIYLSEYASENIRGAIKPILEVLAGIPTVVYGYFALTFITEMLQRVNETVPTFNALSAGIVVGIMILPMVASLSASRRARP